MSTSTVERPRRPAATRPLPASPASRPVPSPLGGCPDCARPLRPVRRLQVSVAECAGCGALHLSAEALSALLETEQGWVPPRVSAFAPRDEQTDPRERHRGRLEVLRALAGQPGAQER